MNFKKLELLLFSNNRLLLDSLLWCSTFGYPSDSLASCLSRDARTMQDVTSVSNASTDDCQNG